jgi:hypothetical protein
VSETECSYKLLSPGAQKKEGRGKKEEVRALDMSIVSVQNTKFGI